MRHRGGRRRRILIGVGAGVLVAVGLAALAIGGRFAADLRVVERRLAAEGRIVATAAGPVEIAEWGEGPPVLVVHGAGGGFDQGRLIAEMYGGDGHRWVAPSRFGYLGTPLPADASTAAQADAFAALLDALGLERVAVLAMSGGVPPALLLAARHPDRVASLVLVSAAPYTPFGAGDQQMPVPAWLYQALFASDFPFWALARIWPAALEGAFDLRPELRAQASPAEMALVARLVAAFQPVSRRQAGLRNEAAAIDPQAHYPLAAIAAPTLVIHARDDAIAPFAVGAHTAAGVPGAVFLPLDSGGHLLLGRRDEVRPRIEAFLRAHAPPEGAPRPGGS